MNLADDDIPCSVDLKATCVSLLVLKRLQIIKVMVILCYFNREVNIKTAWNIVDNV